MKSRGTFHVVDFVIAIFVAIVLGSIVGHALHVQTHRLETAVRGESK